ncbi:uncharacterized protein LOC143753698 isoform X1 [Siphateles boraxobius]|uniref:uncharacterized protein LOC143753698 isoform X1 n=1 Tax=Siphateles boraxobius TaxID=180520 RepID=UPI004063F624
MEWRIIVPVLCLIGILHVPGNVAQVNNTNITDRFTLRFSINDSFLDVYINSTNNATIDLRKNITSQVESLYKAKYEDFEHFEILQIRNGSIVIEGELQFTNGSKPNVTDLTQILNNGNFTFVIIKDAISIAEVTPLKHSTTGPAATTPATTPNTSQTASPVTNQTATPVTTVSAPAKVAQINLGFSIVQDFKDIYSNLSNTETKELSNNITTACSRVYKSRFPKFLRMNILKFSKGSVVIDSVLEFDSTNGTSPNVTDVKDTLVTAITNGNFSFTINNSSINTTNIPETSATTPATTPNTSQTASPVTNQTATPVTTVSAPAKVAQINLFFSIVQDFKDIYSNLSNTETKELSNNITTACSRVYKSRFPKFLRMNILKFSKGSVVIDSVLEFDSTNGTSPNVTDVKDTLVTAITNGNFSFTINNSSINTTNIPETSATTPATTPNTSQTATPVTTVSAPAKVAQINLFFSIVQDFKDIYSDLNNTETKELSNNITTACSRVYKSRFPKFYRMFIRKFSKGSIVIDSVLEFDSTNGTSPNVTDVKDTLVTAITNGNFSFTINNSSINTTDIPETSATTDSAASNLTDYNITFKMNNAFTNDLLNMTSDGAKKLAKNVTSELDGFCKGFRNFKRSLVWKFSSGSIKVDGLLGFNDTLANNPNATELARGLAEAVRNGTVKLPVDPKSINVTDSSRFTANRSPVLASMLTALWMTLASLLLSAVMH